MGRKELFMRIGFFNSEMVKGFIWYYLGLTVSLTFFKFFEISPQRLYTFNFHQNKNIFSKTNYIFIKSFIFSYKSTAI